MPQYGSHFSLGYVSAIPTGATPTPLIFGLLKDVSVDISIGMKEIYGQHRWPIAAGYGEGKVTGKIGSMSVFGGTLGYLLGVTPTTGSIIGVPGETFTIPTTPYQCTVANSATFSTDHGVLDLTSGLVMTRAASSPGAINEYTVTAGVYTFHSTAASHVVTISYSYTAAAVGKTTVMLNAFQSLASPVRLVCYGPGSATNVMGLDFASVVIPKLSLALKTGDWTAQNVDFTAIESTTGATIATFYTGE